MRAGYVAIPLLRYGLTAPWLVAAAACSGRAVFVLYVLVLVVGCPTPGDASCCWTRAFCDECGGARAHHDRLWCSDAMRSRPEHAQHDVGGL